MTRFNPTLTPALSHEWERENSKIPSPLVGEGERR
jgi:hypothetical protein